MPEIENPRLWRLSLELSARAMHVVLSSMVSDSTLHQYSVPINPANGYLKGLEDAVYASPEVLGDYGHVDLLVESQAYVPVPTELSDEEAIACAAHAQLTDNEELSKIFVDRSDVASLAWTMPEELASFLARTFRNAPVHLHITPLIKYLHKRASLGNSAKLFAHLGAETVDIISFSADGKLNIAATHRIESDADAAYYILACAVESGLDLANDEIQLCGDSQRRHSVMPLVAKYAARVMPLIFPSAALRAGREAFKAPFPLIIVPLCE